MKIKINTSISRTLLVVIVLAFVFISGCSQQTQTPTDTLKSSQEKSENLNYIIKYEGATKTNSKSEHFHVVLTKFGENEKTQTYSENKLIQEFIKNQFGAFACEYSIYNSCFESVESDLGNYFEDIKKLSDSGLVNTKSAGEKTTQVGTQTRTCDNIEFVLDLSKFKVSPQDSELGQVLMESRSGNVCLDKGTGLVLESSYLAQYKNLESDSNFQTEIAYKAIELQINPSLAEEDFYLPENVNIIPFEER